MIDITAVSLLDILPPNLKRDATVAAAAQAIDAEMQGITAAIKAIPYFDRLDTLTSEEADQLAWQLHVDFYDPSLPLYQRRELVKSSFAWHKRKGTKSAVEQLITTVFGDGQVQEWFEYGGNPGTFRVISSNSAITNEDAQKFLDALDSVKNARSHLDAIQITASDDMNLYFGNALHTGTYLTIEQVT